MTAFDVVAFFAVAMIGLFTLGTVVIGGLDLIARIDRYRHYRRMYPLAERGRVWRHVR